MKQTTASPTGRSLLDYAISTLSPEVFSHPVWIRFGQDQPGYMSLIGDLLSTAKNLQQEDPGGACQILLLCAAYQNSAGQHYDALRTTQQAISLAERSKLTKEMIWAIWGACAISMQQENYEQATCYLVDLQATFHKQNEWVLANFMDVVRQSFLQPVSFAGSKSFEAEPNDLSGDSFSIIFDCLQHWGFWTGAVETDMETFSGAVVNETTIHSTLIQSFFSFQRWQGRWRTLVLAIRGELRLQWIRNDLPRSRPEKFSFWKSVRNSLGMHQTQQDAVVNATEIRSQGTQVALLPDTLEKPPKLVSPRKPKSPRKNARAATKRRSKKSTSLIPLAVHMLGPFNLAIADLSMKLSSSRSLSVLKYLLLHHKNKVPREVLMDVFWPDAEPETARNNLNVAMHSLRRALGAITELPVVIFENGTYGLSPTLQVWLDVDEFDKCVKAGQRLESRDQLASAVTEYESAISLYQGDFLEQNVYEEWTLLDRERLRVAYLDTLDHLSQIYFAEERYAACITICQRILKQDRCREDAHCLLMRCYSRQGQNHLALRQYQLCTEVLRAELDVDPAPETKQIYERVRQHERI